MTHSRLPCREERQVMPASAGDPRIPSGRRTGFALVELLVVIAIVVVLLGILLPVVGRVRDGARQTKCAAHLRELGAALVAYSNAHRGQLPAWGGRHVYPPGSSVEDEPGDGWTEQLAPHYVPPDSPAYTCPTFEGTVVTYFLSGRWSGVQRRHSMKLSEVRLPSQFVLSGDSTNRDFHGRPYGGAQHRLSTDCDPDDSNAPCTNFPGDGRGFLMHKGGNNLLSADLHVQAFKKFDASAMTFDATAMRPWAEVVPATNTAPR
jgi:prepilin-type N-terminal cleavage/methylation domain-containing protein